MVKTPWYFLFFVGIGILCLVAGVKNYMDEEIFFATAEQDTATITKYVPDPNYKTADFCPVYEFTDKAGNTHSYIGEDCSSRPDPNKIGQQEQVYIDPKVSPKVPQIIETKGLFGSEGSGLMLGMLGCVFFPVIGLIPYLASIFSKRTKAANTSRVPVTESSDDAEVMLADLEKQEEEQRRKIEKGRR